MKYAVLSGLFVISILSVSALAVDFPQYTDRYVNDFAGILNADQISGLRVLLSDIEQNTTAQVVVVTVGNLSGYAPSQYATELAAQWGVGRADVDNGLLILYASTENKIFAATGYGMEGILPDSKIGRLLDQYYVPQRDAGNVPQGIVDFTQAAAGVISSAGASEWGSGSASEWPLLPVIIFIVIAAVFMAIMVVSIRASSVKCDRCGLKMKLVRTEPPSWGSAGYTYVYRCPNGHEKKVRRSYLVAGAAGGVAGRGFGGGFGGGGGGFGGGGFGGGGAGR